MKITTMTYSDQDRIKTFLKNQDVSLKGLTLIADEDEIKGIVNTADFKIITYLNAVDSKTEYDLLKAISQFLLVDDEPHFNTYEEVYAFINAQKSRVYSLDHFKAFMHELYDIQFALPCVHIGGTNGKGSTTNYTKQVLMEAGYKVGCFTSPALVRRTDIIKVNDVSISEELLVAISNHFMDIWVAHELSLFEIEMFICVIYFLMNHVDIALFEVGLGGTLDATNIIKPLLAVNTNIGLDHVDYLGDTYESIAENKAGIIKDGIDYMTGETRDVCLDVFKRETEKHHSQLLVIDHPQNYEVSDGIDYDYHGYHIHLNTLAVYQVDNSALAINILEYIRPYFNWSDDNLIDGLANAFWAGRFEKISDKPLIYIDGAHNKEGMTAFYESAKHFHEPHIIFSALRDKDTHHMMEILCSLSSHVTVTQFSHYRAQSAELLAEDFDVEIDLDWHHAINEALTKDDVILITGSLYFISQVRPYLISRLSLVK